MALFRSDDVTRITQHCFKTLLLALSRPGTIHPLNQPLESAFSHLSLPSSLSAVAHTILDEQVTLAPCSPDGEAWVEELASSTGTRRAPLAEADYVLGKSVPTLSKIRLIKQGTLLAPEDGATLLLWCDQEISGSAGTVRIAGPGIESSLLFRASGTLIRLFKKRMTVPFEYPMGFDIFVISAEGILGLPRTSTLEIPPDAGGA
jgi:alpha-D-ribose 1-methylphosphonate 5-triphosphate synthase subunit PhnH